MSAPQAQDPAAEAFDHLRAEVSLLRRAIEGLAASQPEAPADYAPTLAHLAGGVEAIRSGLEALGQSPSLSYSPETLAAQIQSIVMQTRQEAAAEMRLAIDSLGRTHPVKAAGAADPVRA